MIVVLMTDNEQVQLLDPSIAEKWDDHVASGIEAGIVTRPGIVNEHVVSGAHHGRETLPHVQQRQPVSAVLRARNRRPG